MCVLPFLPLLVGDIALAQSCPWHCRVWAPDACNTCTCENGQIGSCTKAGCFDQPAVQARCVDPKSASNLRPQQCRWFGTAPFCSGSCDIGYQQVLSSKRGDGKKCVTGSKVYCCQIQRGQSPETCFDYAAQAVAQYTLAVQRNCAVTPPVWDLNFDHHYNWCIGLSDINQAIIGASFRQNFLATQCPG